MEQIGSSVHLILLEKYIRDTFFGKKDTEIIFFQYPHYSEKEFIESLKWYRNPNETNLIKGYRLGSPGKVGFSVGFLETKKESISKKLLMDHLHLFFEEITVLEIMDYPIKKSNELVIILNTKEAIDHCFQLIRDLQSNTREKFREVFCWESVISLPNKKS